MPEPINQPLAIITRTIVGLLVLMASFGIVLYLANTRPQIQQTPLDQALPQVQVIKAAPVAVHLQWSGYGSVSAMDRSDVPSRVTSTVKTMSPNLEAGNTVKAGDLLVILDDSDFRQQQQIAQQNIAQIKANLEKLNSEESFLTQQKKLDDEDVQLSTREWQRTKELFDRKAGTQQDVDRASQTLLIKQKTQLATAQQLDQLANRRNELNAQLQAQQASLQRATLDVQRCRITSPMDGVLQSLDVDLGEMVTSGKRIARVVNLIRMEVALQLPASARSAVGIGDRVMISPVGLENLQWPNTITRIAPEDDPTTRTLTVYVQFDATSSDTAALSPGRYVQGVVQSHKIEQHWLAPSRSVQADQIMIVREGRVMTLEARITHLLKEHFPSLNLPDESWAILGTELQPGDAIILTPSRLVSDGKQVAPVVVADQSTLGGGVTP